MQNNPPKFVPEEGKVVAHILEALKPHSTENGGPLKVAKGPGHQFCHCFAAVHSESI